MLYLKPVFNISVLKNLFFFSVRLGYERALSFSPLLLKAHVVYGWSLAAEAASGAATAERSGNEARGTKREI